MAVTYRILFKINPKIQRGVVIRPTIPTYMIEDEDSDESTNVYGSVDRRTVSRRQLPTGKITEDFIFRANFQI